ncbi:hypothetical protein MIR68_001997 [Amoeboaphelidium protococcarum]|nr:hypothetical protein MIR68_001997 [Amoeboaphelidium protococcarum]
MEVQLEELKKLKVAELKEKLQEYELPVSGKKDELIERLYNHLQSLAQQQQQKQQQQQQQQQVIQQQLQQPQVNHPQQQQQSGAFLSASQQPPALTQSVNVQMQHGTAVTTKPAAVDSPVSPQKDVVMQPALDPHKVIVIPPVEVSSEISEEERRKRRAERFNIPYREPKKDDADRSAHSNNRRRQYSHDRVRGGQGGGSGGAMRNRLSGPRRDDRRSGGGGDRLQRGGRGGHRDGHGGHHRPRYDGHDKRDDGRRFEPSHGVFNNADSSMNPDASAVSFSDQLQQPSQNEGVKFGWNTGANTAAPPASEDVVMNE